VDIESARSGGQIFLHNDALYRPAQNCLISYGRSIILNKITELSEEKFTENWEMEITPNQLGSYKEGIHTISKLGENLTLVDGKKYVFALHKPLISLFRLLLKLFKKISL
jgi:hypothetical protein